MKKSIAITISIAMIITLLAGCAKNDTASPEDADGKLKIVTTIFPLYDWTRNITADKADVSMLLGGGADIHSFQPTADDVMKISKCDVFIYVGGESDDWVSEALDKVSGEEIKVIDLIDVLGDKTKEEELAPGMQESAGDGDKNDNDDTEYDEHVWLSLKNAALLCDHISKIITEVDSENADEYLSNAARYVNGLNDLDAKYKKAAENAKVRTLLFADRFPFRYLTDDYDLDYYAAFSGCSAETEASFETISFLSKKIDELSLRHVFTIEGSDGKIARTIIESTKNKDQDVLTLDSMQSVTVSDVKDGADYLDIMSKNLNVLKTALAN